MDDLTLFCPPPHPSCDPGALCGANDAHLHNPGKPRENGRKLLFKDISWFTKNKQFFLFVKKYPKLYFLRFFFLYPTQKPWKSLKNSQNPSNFTVFYHLTNFTLEFLKRDNSSAKDENWHWTAEEEEKGKMSGEDRDCFTFYLRRRRKTTNLGIFRPFEQF